MQKLTQDEFQKILQIGEVDVGNNTLFARSSKLPISRNHLTLVISSGGSGAAAISEAIKTAQQKLEVDYSQYMKFIMVESATNEIEGTERELGSNTLRILNISIPGAEDRLTGKNRHTFYREFVPKNYDTTNLNPHGSGRDRLAGKIKFYDETGGNYNDVKFRNMIKELYGEKGDWTSKKSLPVDIMILSGLAGGTGSGTFMELAAHARQACKEAGALGEIRIFGYLFLPDTVEQFEADNQDNLSQLYVNGYSALKELESYMSVSFSPDREVTFKSRDGVTNIVINGTNRLFNYPVLISGGYEETKSMMAECIINLAIENDGEFDHNSFYSNENQSRDGYLASPNRLNGGLLKEDVFPEDSHRYAGIGYAYAAIPEKIVTANVVSNVCRKLYQPDPLLKDEALRFCTADNRMNRTEMEAQIRRLFTFSDKQKLTKESFWEQKIKGALNQASALSQNNNEITREEINSGNTRTYELGFGAEGKVIAGIAQMQSHLQTIYAVFEENAVKIMKDYGPRAMEYLFTGKGPDDQNGYPQYYKDISIEGMLEYAKEQLQEIIGDGRRANRPSERIPSGLIEVIFKSRMNEWKSRFHAAVQYETKQNIARRMTEPEGLWDKYLIDPVKRYREHCRSFTERIEALANFYRSAGSALDDTNYITFMQQSQTDNCVSLCTDANVYKWVRDQVDRKIKSISLTEVKNEIIESFHMDSESWISNDVGKTRAVFDGVMSKCCAIGNGSIGENGISLTATAYFEHMLSQVSKEQVGQTADRIVKEMVARLLEKSAPATKTKGGSSIVNRFMLFPKSLKASPYGEVIEKALKQAWSNGVGDGAEAKISASEAVNDIVCYQTSVANGLCDLIDLPKWEKRYNDSTSSSKHLSNGEYGNSYIERTKTELEAERALKEGRKNVFPKLGAKADLIFGTGLSWEHYPPLALKNLKENKKEKAFCKEFFDPIVDYALEEKIIQRKKGTDTDEYLYVVNLLPEDWTNLDVSNYDQIGPDGRAERGEALFRYLHELNPLGSDVFRKDIVLAGSGYFSDTYDFSEARHAGAGKTDIYLKDISLQYMKRILRKNTYLFLELRDTLFRYYEIAESLTAAEKGKLHQFQVKQFIEYYRYGMIAEKNQKWSSAINSNGGMSVFCKFDDLDMLNYTEFEKQLVKKGWQILLAFKQSRKLDFKKLNELRTEKLYNLTQQDVNELKEENTQKLKLVLNQIKTCISDNLPAQDTQAAIEKEFSLTRGTESFYVNTIILLKAILEELISESDPEPQTDNHHPEDSWECPSCGRPGNTTLFCPGCGSKRPKSEKAMVWTCPNCGREGNTTKFCPECGTPQVSEAPSKEWYCPDCGAKNKGQYCVNCGKKKQ